MAGILPWFPDTLYNSAIRTIVANFNQNFQNDLKTFPENVVFDICYKLYTENRLCQLGFEFCQIDLFARILKVKDKRDLLHHCVQALMDHGAHTTKLLSVAFKRNCFHMANISSEKTIRFGLSLAEFLAEAGWFEDSEEVSLATLHVCKNRNDVEHLKMSLECCIKLLNARTQFCKFFEATKTFKETIEIVEKLKHFNVPINYSCVYGAFMGMYFSRSEYSEAYKWSLRALKELTSNIPPNFILDILRQAARACVVKREFKRADLLIKQALSIAKEKFGDKHPRTADTMLDYGFYLLNVDSVAQSVKVYQTALDIRQSAFGGHNLLVAIAHEDLAYALYVQEYSTGKFEDAKDHAEKALQIMSHLLPPDHLLLASSKRVKALVLEEIAIDNQDKIAEHQLLMEAQELHLAALQMTRLAFGEMNVQTAKHYGNLGRLYQSMRRYNEAEQMHLKAIEIKEEILGPEDYEVALSVGHLASLYNYDMKIFDKAEQLYLKSINIGLKLFGTGYSGLEYDYRGLLRVYLTMGKHEKYLEYNNILREWKVTRDLNAQEIEATSLPPNMRLIPPERILREFLSIE